MNKFISILMVFMPPLTAAAISWAENQERKILVNGRQLDERQMKIAKRVGVSRPEMIRILLINKWTQNLNLALVFWLSGLIGPAIIGITLGHAIAMHGELYSERIFSHECRHIFQYEQAGSIAEFLPMYFAEVVEAGYKSAPLELDALEHEIIGVQQA